jgi:hypothetical protein
MVDVWKLATVSLAVALVVVLVRSHRRRPGEFGEIGRGTGQIRPDTRGTQQHAVMTSILGAKKVAEGAKRDLLGPEKADARDEQKKLRVA